MNCVGIIDHLSDALDGGLDDAASADVLAHLRICPACRVAAEGVLRIHRTALLLDVIEENVPALARTTSRQRRARRHPRVHRYSGLPALAWFSGLVAACLVAVWLWTRVAPVEPEVKPWASIEMARDLRVDGLPADSSGALNIGSRLQVGALGVARVRLADGSTVEIASDSRLAMLEPAGVELRLDEGEVTVRARPQAAGRPLAVVTGLARAEVVGTAFAVAHRDGLTRLDVSEGRVHFATPAASGEHGPGASVWALPENRRLIAFDAHDGLQLVDFEVASWVGVGARAISGAASRPHFKDVDSLPGLCLNGTDQVMRASLGRLDVRHGATVVMVANALEQKSGIQGLLALGDDLVLEVKDQRTLSAVVGDVRASVTVTGRWAAALRWHPDGRLDLRTHRDATGKVVAAPPTLMSDAFMTLAQAPGRDGFEGNIHLVRLHARVLGDLELTQELNKAAQEWGCGP